MTGFEIVCESIRIFESSLTAIPIRSVTELAGRAGYSVFHFTRLFSAVAGVAPKDYLQGRILSESARKVAETVLPLRRIAEDAGYPDYESFSRAFKKRFGLAPGEARKVGRIPEGLMHRIIPTKNPGYTGPAEPELITLDPFSVTGLPFRIEEGARSFHRQWEDFMRVESAIRGLTTPKSYYQHSSWTPDTSVMVILCGLSTQPGTAQDPVFVTRDIPGASYLRFVHADDVSTLRQTYEYIYRDWLSAHEVEPLDCWEFQACIDEKRETVIYVPVSLS